VVNKNPKVIYIIKKAYLVTLLSVPFLLLYLPADYFDNGESICPSKYFLKIECLGCGLTRAIMHLIHLDFVEAWAYNKLSFLILIGLIMFWLYLLGKLINKPIFRFIDKLI
jgi:hypothetical protein